uniref:Nucleolar protein 12 n=1 Tax=Amblyomma americanum TaxID=6943 RepID=A0A0C9SD13_AMBAM
MKKKRSKQPPKKIHLVFDERERREFLTGFQKRKKERQKKAQEKIMQEAKEEKRRLKAEKREIMQRLLGDKPVPGSGADKEDEEEPVTYDLPDHTVTVTSLESSDLYGDVRIGDNRADDNEEEDDDSIGDEIERGRTTDSDKRRLKALDRQMGDCSVQLRAALHKDKKQRGKMRRIKLRTTKKAKLARTHRL